MEPSDWLPYITALVPAAGWFLQWRKHRSETDASYKDEAREERKLRREAEEEAESLRDTLEDATSLAEAREEELEKARMEIIQVKAELASCCAAFPALLWPHLQAITADLTHVLDVAGAFTITEPVGGGTFRWVSERFAAGLGMGRDEFMACDWKTRLHPQDRERTSAAESAAQGGRVRLTNRFLHKDGATYVWVRWTSTQYLAGISFSFVEFLDVPKEE